MSTVFGNSITSCGSKKNLRMIIEDESYDQVKTSILTVLAAIELCRVLSLIKKYISEQLSIISTGIKLAEK